MKEDEKCAKECRIPCKEITFKIKEKYESNKRAGARVRLFFYFEELKETVIEHVPRHTAGTLLANFGGQLGLMAGVSAISIVELLIWFVLVLIDRLHVIYETL